MRTLRPTIVLKFDQAEFLQFRYVPMDLENIAFDESGNLPNSVGHFTGDRPKQLEVLRPCYLMELRRDVKRALEVRLRLFAGVDLAKCVLDSVAIAPLKADVQNAFRVSRLASSSCGYGRSPRI
jgi:hypothetical protein